MMSISPMRSADGVGIAASVMAFSLGARMGATGRRIRKVKLCSPARRVAPDGSRA
jgi:hypothetical protein